MSENDPRDYRSLGDLLRDARAERKLNLEQVNESTKISSRVLQALEQDDLDAASGVVYARGFVRTLALFYDLDPEWLGAKLDQLAGETSRPVMPVADDDGVIAGPVDDPVEEDQPEAAGPKWEVESTRVRHVGASQGTKVPRNLLYGLVAVLVIAIIVVVWIGRGNERADHGAQRTPAAIGDVASADDDPGPVTQPVVEDDLPDEAASETTDEPEVDPPVQQDADPVQAQPAEIVVEDTPTSPIDRTPASQLEVTDRSTDRPADRPVEEQPSVADPVIEDEVPVPATTTMVEAEESDQGEVGGLPSVLRPSAGTPGVRMELKVVADGPVEITLSADGSRGEVRTLDAGEEWTVEGRDHFSLAVSDPALVRLEIDGRPRAVPAGWNGEEWILYPPRGEGGDR